MNSRGRNRPHSNSQLKSIWDGKSDRKRRVFNQHTSNLKGKISIDAQTVINYDYSGDQPQTNFARKNQGSHIEKDKFSLSSYPVLKSIVIEIPKNTNNLREMDLFLMKDLDEALLWRNSEFEFHS